MARTRMMSVWSGVVIVVLTTAWFWSTVFDQAGSRESLSIADAFQPVFALLYVAEAEGYFDDEGLDVTFRSFSSGRDALACVVASECDLATVYETPVVLQSYNGRALSVLTQLHSSTRNTALVCRRDHGISQPADIAGKRIGVPPNTNAEFFLGLYLASEGIPETSVTFVPISPPDAAIRLRDGTVDGVAVWNPNLLKAQECLPAGETITFYSDVYTEMSVLASTREFADQRGPAVEKLLRALVRAETFKRNQPDRALDIVVTRLSADEQSVRKVWDSFETEIALDHVLLAVLTGEAEWFKDQGRFRGPIPDFRRVIQSDFLREVSPEAVTIVD